MVVMTSTADRYRSLAATMTDRIAAIPDDRWESPTPCDDWNTRELVRHLVDTQGMFLGFIGQEVDSSATVDDDPLAAWAAARDTVQGALDDPEVAGTEYDGYFGRTTFEQTIDKFGCFDLLVHGWDIARAAGLDETLDPAEVHRVFEDARSLGDSIRLGGVCGPEIEAPAGADDQTQLLSFLGRQV